MKLLHASSKIQESKSKVKLEVQNFSDLCFLEVLTE